ncbi:unnamed protein product [Camellia sinensis]
MLVLRKHGDQGYRNKGMVSDIHTVFVGNLPETMDPKGLYKVFTNFGIVKDVFIPNKRRKMKRSIFGFVGYACPVVANMAVQKAHGLWCDNRALKVRVADFGKDQGKQRWPLKAPIGGRQIVMPLSCVATFKEELQIRGMGDIQARDGGGKDIVVTFESVESMKENLKLMEKWIHEWCESIKKWKQGMAIEQERLVWLTCYGVPLNLWSSNTFMNIGELWGEVIGIDDDTSRMHSLHSGKSKEASPTH